MQNQLRLLKVQLKLRIMLEYSLYSFTHVRDQSGVWVSSTKATTLITTYLTAIHVCFRLLAISPCVRTCPAPVARAVRGGRPGRWVTHQLQVHLRAHLVATEACSPPLAQELSATAITAQLPPDGQARGDHVRL